MVGVLFYYVLDPKVVNNKGENDGLGGVLPERWGSGHRSKSKMGKVSFELVVGDAAEFIEAGQPFSNL